MKVYFYPPAHCSKTELERLTSYLAHLDQAEGVFLAHGPEITRGGNYIRLRRKEGWLYDDDNVKCLPQPNDPDPEHRRIWQLRGQSAEKVFRYCETFENPFHLAEIGCGNGWFLNRLAQSRKLLTATGIDINLHELKQAARVFPSEKMRFVFADIFSDPLPHEAFDIIIFNGSIQYFPDLRKVLGTSRSFLKPGGQILVADSPFYESGTDREAARRRTADYFKKMDAPEMTGSYHHHLYADAESCGGEILYRPGKKNLLNLLKLKKQHPFPLIRFRKGETV